MLTISLENNRQKAFENIYEGSPGREIFPRFSNQQDNPQCYYRAYVVAFESNNILHIINPIARGATYSKPLPPHSKNHAYSGERPQIPLIGIFLLLIQLTVAGLHCAIR
jgi:hypothetical protein